MCGAEVRDNTQVPYLCAIIASVVATVFVLLRLFVIFTPGGKNPGWDDAMLVVCLVSPPIYQNRWLLTWSRDLPLFLASCLATVSIHSSYND